VSQNKVFMIKKRKKEMISKRLPNTLPPLFYSSRVCTTLKLNQRIKLLNQDPKLF